LLRALPPVVSLARLVARVALSPELRHLALQLAETLAQLPGARQIVSQPLPLGIVLAGRSSDAIGETLQRARQVATGLCLSGLVALLQSARKRAHALGGAAVFELPCGGTQPVALGAIAAAAKLPQPLLQRVDALGQALLFCRRTPSGIGVVALRSVGGAVRQLPLPLGELPCLELCIAHRSTALVGAAVAQCALDPLQALEGSRALLPCLLRVLAPQVAGGIPHVLGRLPHRRRLRSVA